jgi:hypothetical protein
MIQMIFKGCHMTFEVRLSNLGSFSACMYCPFCASGVLVPTSLTFVFSKLYQKQSFLLLLRALFENRSCLTQLI